LKKQQNTAHYKNKADNSNKLITCFTVSHHRRLFKNITNCPWTSVLLLSQLLLFLLSRLCCFGILAFFAFLGFVINLLRSCWLDTEKINGLQLITWPANYINKRQARKPKTDWLLIHVLWGLGSVGKGLQKLLESTGPCSFKRRSTFKDILILNYLLNNSESDQHLQPQLHLNICNIGWHYQTKSPLPMLHTKNHTVAKDSKLYDK